MWQHNHAEYLLIGFVFMFLLALVLYNGNVEYEIGTDINSSVTYNGDNIEGISQQISYDYNSFNDTTSRNFGLYLAIASIAGFGITLASIRRTQWGSE